MVATTQPAQPLTSDVVEVRLRIASDFDSMARDVDSFREGFREGMAAAGGISKDRILVRSITKGSIVVDFIVTGAQQIGDVSAAAALQDVEAKLTNPSYLWPTVLRPMMAEGASVEAKATKTMDKEQLDAMAVLSGSGTVFMTPEAGYVAPSGCSCVAGEGISFGCANHKSLSPPWCLVASGCRESLEGAMGAWAFCVQQSQDTSGGSTDGNRLVIASGNGSAAGIFFWLFSCAILLRDY